MTDIIIVIAGLAGGLLAGLFGVGGGVIFVPVLVLGLGLTQLHAEAASLLAILPTAIIGTWRQIKFGNTDLRAAIVIGGVSIIGVQIGVISALHLPDSTLRRMFGVLLLFVAVQTVRRAQRTT
jgi:hypothetical protein